MIAESISTLPVVKVNAEGNASTTDTLAVEEPLEIRIEYGENGQRQIQNISVTMRTPGQDAELAIGFLFTEGIISSIDDIEDASHCFIACTENKENVIQVKLKPGVVPVLNKTDRNFYTTSSCGVCGKASIGAIRTVSGYNTEDADSNSVYSEMLLLLPAILHKHQEVFAETGGLHASALFTTDGELVIVKEDVGRHNALDKLVGVALKNEMLPLNEYVLLLSGRASFELVQKAVMAGINIIAAVGAPSTLAVQLAKEFNVTLVGFLRARRFNIYSGEHRIIYTP